MGGDFGENRQKVEVLLSQLDCVPALQRLELEVADIQDRYAVKDTLGIVDWLASSQSASWSWHLLGCILLNARREGLANSAEYLNLADLGIAIARLEGRSKVHRNAASDVLSCNIARRYQDVPVGKGHSLLTKEANKKRALRSPRVVMEEGAEGVMLRHKPCWLMSPLSISQFLPCRAGVFDTVIFDEASQVRVENALPAIERAKRLVVVGDPLQMPPTHFFANSADDEEDLEDDAESILDLAVRACPQVVLEWHYRSHDEALIAFSNRAFYGGRLVAPPSPSELGGNGAVQFKRVQEAYFTQKTGNPVEAQAVVTLLCKLLREAPSRSVGVIAMGQSQAKVIEQTLASLCERDKELASLMDAATDATQAGGVRCFVKNLENVQGDEADVIIISMGYAPAGPGKKMRLGFGPLSGGGGRRRLNVAATRARHLLHVFCSFNPSEIPADEGSPNQDLTILGKFLRYCAALGQGKAEDAQGILNSFGVGGAVSSRKPSRFALDVQRRLQERGWVVVSEVGSCGYFVDLAIAHPSEFSRFVLGIECDGMLFHTLPDARTRDGLRQRLLETRGWAIERIGSVEWSQDWMASIGRIEQRLTSLGHGTRRTTA